MRWRVHDAGSHIHGSLIGAAVALKMRLRECARLAVEKPNHRHNRMLRGGSRRPRDRGDAVAPPDAKCHLPLRPEGPREPTRAAGSIRLNGGRLLSSLITGKRTLLPPRRERPRGCRAAK